MTLICFEYFSAHIFMAIGFTLTVTVTSSSVASENFMSLPKQSITSVTIYLFAMNFTATLLDLSNKTNNGNYPRLHLCFATNYILQRHNFQCLLHCLVLLCFPRLCIPQKPYPQCLSHCQELLCFAIIHNQTSIFSDACYTVGNCDSHVFFSRHPALCQNTVMNFKMRSTHTITS